MSIIDAARATIRRHALLPPGSRVVVALSGGADSVALLFALREISEPEGFCVAGAAHLNHQLRGPEADADEQFCRDLARQLELPIHIERIDVAARARETGASIEHAAHTERHAFFDRAAAHFGASAVAVAHTRNDQAETFLLRLLRGAGPRGLSGMHPRTGIVVRPLIDTSRDEVRMFLRERGVGFREDASNADLAIPRNRIRHELLPLLEARFAPGIVDILDREATIARDDADYLDAAACAASARLITQTDHGVELDADALAAETPAIARRVVRLAQQMAAGPDHFVGFDASEAVRRFAVSKSTGQLDLPGHRVNRRGGAVVLTASRGREKPPATADFLYQLEVPGQVAVPEAACAISADTQPVPTGRSAAEVFRLAGRSNEAVIEAGRLASPLLVRNRRPGDVFRPLGLHGHKKLQDFFVDAKIDRFEREITPVIVDSAGRIVWVAGHALAEDFRVTEATRDVVILKRTPM
ncbi:MAG TPA: tRNA lysidine(34) synthetase TilS [Vicinamibacterales bacterium]|nr:tRNA lysidine(34) synthetase TilS [Vicinamibacterales bacterium]